MEPSPTSTPRSRSRARSRRPGSYTRRESVALTAPVSLPAALCCERRARRRAAEGTHRSIRGRLPRRVHAPQGGAERRHRSGRSGGESPLAHVRVRRRRARLRAAILESHSGSGRNMVRSRGSRQIDIVSADATKSIKGPVVQRHFATFSPEISLNFGHRQGWSYISGGMFGRSKLYLDREDTP